MQVGTAVELGDEPLHRSAVRGTAPASVMLVSNQAVPVCSAG
ncbi:hypothetical protein RAJCM14343_3825 [Rhodococcus aetherivorans]|uniref:Uncharacterized protein n=1 Tax=Rhodococcus aetherivorans TaxID=191292 RepID=A0ABQ0YPQ6_9NOCA|nr:hypothetical protein RAJCM14343_3825 [Rhodococcus aetherivorans]